MTTFLRPSILASLSLAGALSAGYAQAATSQWFGIWKLRIERADQTPETLLYSDAGNGAMRMVSVEDKSEIVTHWDGQPSADTGAGSQDWTLAIKATSEASYRWTFAKRGKPVAQGLNTLADDAKTFREISWPVGDPTKTTTVTYERQ